MSDVRFERMNTNQLSERLDKAPIAYVPIGSLEHHGPHLPVGFDSMNAHRLCLAAAEKIGGVVLPPTFWGAFPCLPGIENSAGSLLLRRTTIAALAENILDELIARGYRVIVALTGHNPGEQGRLLSLVAERCMRKSHAPVRILQPFDFRKHPADPPPGVSPDHASRFETSLALHLFPELVDMEALERPGGRAGISPEDTVTEASAELGKTAFDWLVGFIASVVEEALRTTPSRLHQL